MYVIAIFSGNSNSNNSLSRICLNDSTKRY